ncbi:DUF6146 family protein [Flavobacterium sp. AG291]|uniref:DUF6146 family protein n=1 Tax=Flavobacterium sp. AG291 TaxID=2184000 RepID=UPI000E0B472F|nr:DUF6146 family protein [Flavobacterium sp. AG291]RDI14398.1 hypothetical protein DEU42_10290 [Flavobacterium sp. AG291]
MKYNILLLSGLIALIIACSTKNNVASNNKDLSEIRSKNDTIRIANDSLEYEIIIIDPGFNSWLASRAKPRGFYGQPYLENKNRFWVNEWNARAMNPQRFGELYQMQIDYKPQINYGYEVNYLLYNYLVFFQVTNNQKLGGIIPQ